MKINPNELRHYVSKEALEELEVSLPKIDTDLSKVTFFLWTPELGIDQPWEFKAGIDPQELINRHFDPERPTKFISHAPLRSTCTAQIPPVILSTCIF